MVLRILDGSPDRSAFSRFEPGNLYMVSIGDNMPENWGTSAKIFYLKCVKTRNDRVLRDAWKAMSIEITSHPTFGKQLFKTDGQKNIYGDVQKYYFSNITSTPMYRLVQLKCDGNRAMCHALMVHAPDFREEKRNPPLKSKSILLSLYRVAVTIAAAMGLKLVTTPLSTGAFKPTDPVELEKVIATCLLQLSGATLGGTNKMCDVDLWTYGDGTDDTEFKKFCRAAVTLKLPVQSVSRNARRASRTRTGGGAS